MSGLSSAKIRLWNDMLAQQMGTAELAQFLDLPTSRIDALFDLADTRSTDLVEIAARRLRERAAMRSG